MSSEEKTLPDLASDPDTDLVLKTEVVTYKGKGHRLTARTRGLCLEFVQDSKEHGTTTSLVLDLPWRDVVGARAEITEPTSSGSSRPTSRGTTDASSSRDGAGSYTGNVTLHHVSKDRRSNRLTYDRVMVKFSNADVGLQDWLDLIEDKKRPGKPRRLLVIINPIGGKGRGRQVFEKEVRPLLDLAGIDSVVKVTEYVRHAEEIASSFDLTTVDGIVASGGDGLYAEVLHGVVQQTQAKAGVNTDDADSVLHPLPVPIGLLPTGTGNGVSGWINGDVIDVVTATINIIRGAKTHINMLSVHDRGKLLHYCGLRLAYGFLAQMMKMTDDKRWMKKARYPYVLLTSAFQSKHVLDLEVDVLQIASCDQGTGDVSETEGASPQTAKWLSLGRKSVTNLMGWVAEFQVSDEGRMVFNPFSAHADLILQTSTSGMHHLGFLFKMAAKKKDLFDSPSIERHGRVLGFRFRYVGDRDTKPATASSGSGEQGAARSSPLSDKEALSRTLDVDGELMDSDVVSVDCRLHSQFVPVFGVFYVPS